MKKKLHWSESQQNSHGFLPMSNACYRARKCKSWNMCMRTQQLISKRCRLNGIYCYFSACIFSQSPFNACKQFHKSVEGLECLLCIYACRGNGTDRCFVMVCHIFFALFATINRLAIFFFNFLSHISFMSKVCFFGVLSTLKQRQSLLDPILLFSILI